MQVRFKKNHVNAIIPLQTESNAGMDMTAIEVNYTDDYIEYDTKISVEIPDGYVGLMFPRSSNSNKDLLLANSVGVCDSSYRGSLKFRYKLVPRIYMLNDIENNIPKQRLIAKNEKQYQIGDRIGQLIIIPYPKIESVDVGDEELSNTERGAKGFGSSGT